MKKMTKERIDARLPVLFAAHEKLEAKIRANPNHPKVDAYNARMAEYRQSVENIVTHGAETI